MTEDAVVEETTEEPDPVLVELAAELEILVQQNIGIEEDLIRLQVQPNPMIIFQMRLDLALNTLLDDESRFRYEIESAKRVFAILNEIESQVSKARILNPGAAPLPNLQLPR